VSFLLDALRKSDARRRVGETPGLNSPPPSSSGGPGKRRGRRGAVLLALTLVVVLAVALVIIRPAPISDRLQQMAGSATEAEPVVQPIEIEQPARPLEEPHYERRVSGDGADSQRGETTVEQGLARERIVSDPDEIDAELARMVARQAEEDAAAEEIASESAAARRERRGTPSPRTTVVAESPARDQRLAVDPRDTERMERLVRAREARLAEAEAGTRARTAGRASPEPRDPADQSDESWSPSAAEYVRVWELPLSIRRNLPDLRLSIHVFAVEEDQRFVLVNGERFVTGDMISSNVRLVEIRREGAVVDFRDYRFLLEP
jgi:general secretion pathway protein B